MDSTDFAPHNDLESELLAAQEGRISEQQLMQTLLAAQVFVPVRDPVTIAGLQGTVRPEPLTLVDEDGTEVLAVFTSPDRARPVVAGRAGYEGGILMEFRAVLDRVGPGCGLVLNPGWPVGLEMAPEAVSQLTGPGGTDAAH